MRPLSLQSVHFAGAGAATGDVGATCLTGDLCTDTNAYCDTTDATNTVCRCNTGWVAKGALCGKLSDIRHFNPFPTKEQMLLMQIHPRRGRQSETRLTAGVDLAITSLVFIPFSFIIV